MGSLLREPSGCANITLGVFELRTPWCTSASDACKKSPLTCTRILNTSYTRFFNSGASESSSATPSGWSAIKGGNSSSSISSASSSCSVRDIHDTGCPRTREARVARGDASSPSRLLRTFQYVRDMCIVFSLACRTADKFLHVYKGTYPQFYIHVFAYV